MDSHLAKGGTRYGVPSHRKTISERLSEAYSQDMLDQPEFERRAGLAEAATTIEELDALVADFGPRGVAPGSVGSDLPATKGERYFTVFGEQNHVLVPGTGTSLRAVSLLGTVQVDLRAFRGSGATLTVRISGGLSESHLKVPAGTKVVRRSTVILGDFTTKRAKEPGELKKIWTKLFGKANPAPASPYPVDGPPPTVILEGIQFLGDLVVEEDLP